FSIILLFSHDSDIRCFYFQAEDGIRDLTVTGVQTCALPIFACLGDSITAGSPLCDPYPEVRAAIGSAADERSQWLWWAARRDPRLELRNFGVYGERTDEIAARLDRAAGGVDVLVVQGGINDVVQGRPGE